MPILWRADGKDTLEGSLESMHLAVIEAQSEEIKRLRAALNHSIPLDEYFTRRENDARELLKWGPV